MEQYGAKDDEREDWGDHVAHVEPWEAAILYVDLHLEHRVTPAQAFDGLLRARESRELRCLLTGDRLRHRLSM